MRYYSKNIKEVEKMLKTNIQIGLDSKEATNRIKKNGENVIKDNNKKSNIAKFLAQFNDFMVIILLIAGVISFLTSFLQGDKDFLDTIIIVLIVFINAVPAAIYYLVIQLYVTDVCKLPMLFDKSNPVSWILPLISMSLGNIAAYAMWMRRYMVDEMNSDYVKLARAKGVSEKNIMVHHVLRNAFVPMAQYLPASILYTIAGSIYIESLYSIPGMGGLLVEAIQRQDNPLVQGLVIIYSSLGILGLVLGDIAMSITDPRIKLQRNGGGR